MGKGTEDRDPTSLESILNRLNYEIDRAEGFKMHVNDKVVKLRGEIPSKEDTKNLKAMAGEGMLGNLNIAIDRLSVINDENSRLTDSLNNLV